MYYDYHPIHIKMSSFAEYVRSIGSSNSELMEYFENKGFEVISNDSLWMISGDFSEIDGSESTEFQSAMLAARGTILTRDTNIVVCSGLPYPVQLKQDTNNTDITVVPALSGTLVTLFYWNNMWRLSSSQHINVLPTSIGRNFERAIWEVTGDKTPIREHPLILELDTNSCYYFIVSELHGVTHIGCYDMPNSTFYSHRISEFDTLMYHCFPNVAALNRELRYCPDVEYVLLYADSNVRKSAPVYKHINPYYSSQNGF